MAIIPELRSDGKYYDSDSKLPCEGIYEWLSWHNEPDDFFEEMKSQVNEDYYKNEIDEDQRDQKFKNARGWNMKNSVLFRNGFIVDSAKFDIRGVLLNNYYWNYEENSCGCDKKFFYRSGQLACQKNEVDSSLKNKSLYYDSGELAQHSMYKFSQSTHEYYFKNGNRADLFHLNGSQLNGVRLSWYENGCVSLEANYLEGKLDGCLVVKSPKEIVIHTSFWKSGKPHGDFINYYLNSQIESIIPFKNGYMHGIQRNWYYSGEKKTEIEHKDGQFHGRYEEFDTSGHSIRKRYYEEGFELTAAALLLIRLGLRKPPRL